MGKVWRELSGTLQDAFKFGEHRLRSLYGGVALEGRGGLPQVFYVDNKRLAALGINFYSSTSQPLEGTYETGDIVFNRNPREFQTPGWYCVTGGTPGIWSPLNNAPPPEPIPIPTPIIPWSIRLKVESFSNQFLLYCPQDYRIKSLYAETDQDTCSFSILANNITIPGLSGSVSYLNPFEVELNPEYDLSQYQKLRLRVSSYTGAPTLSLTLGLRVL